MNVRPGLNTPLFKEIHLDLVDMGDINGPEIRGNGDKADRELAAQVHDRPMADVPSELQSIFFHSTQKNLAAWRYLEDLEFDWPEVQVRLIETPQAHDLLDRFAEWVYRHHPAD